MRIPFLCDTPHTSFLACRTFCLLHALTKAGFNILVLLTVSFPAWASLGQPEASVTADKQHLKSNDRVQDYQTYRVHELTTSNGITVREYVSPQGLVFGITWQGRFMPNINQLLDTYINDLQTAAPAQTQIRRLRGLSVKTSDFVYTNFCYLLICRGSAYAPRIIPSNVPMAVMR